MNDLSPDPSTWPQWMGYTYSAISFAIFILLSKTDPWDEPSERVGMTIFALFMGALWLPLLGTAAMCVCLAGVVYVPVWLLMEFSEAVHKLLSWARKAVTRD